MKAIGQMAFVVLQIKADFLQIGATFIITKRGRITAKRGTFVTDWCSYDKSGQALEIGTEHMQWLCFMFIITFAKTTKRSVTRDIQSQFIINFLSQLNSSTFSHTQRYITL